MNISYTHLFEPYKDVPLIHVLKTVEPYFTHVWNGYKLFEFRQYDRPFKSGDEVYLFTYPENDRHIRANIGFMLTRFQDRFIWYDENKRGCIFSLLDGKIYSSACSFESGSYIAETMEKLPL